MYVKYFYFFVMGGGVYVFFIFMNFVSFLGLMYVIMIFFVDICSDICVENIFCIEFNIGILDVYIIYVSNSKILLRVYFIVK